MVVMLIGISTLFVNLHAHLNMNTRETKTARQPAAAAKQIHSIYHSHTFQSFIHKQLLGYNLGLGSWSV